MNVFKIKYQIYNEQNRISGKMANSLSEKYKNSAMPHVDHIFQTAYDIAMEKCVHIHHQTIHYRIGDLLLVVMRNAHVWIFQVQNQISKIQMLNPPYDLISINT